MSVHRTVENVYIRQEAVQLTRRHFWRLLGISVLISIITNGLSWVVNAIGDQLMLPEINQVIERYTSLMYSTHITSVEPMLEAMYTLFASPKFILFNLMAWVVTGLVTAGLTLGRTKQLLDTGRGGYPEPLRIFSGMNLCLKAWGVQLWAGLKTGLWCLPGVGLVIIGSELTLYDMAEVGNIVMVIGMVLMLVLGLRTTLRYSMATHLLADEPDRGVRDCVKFSTALMQGRLWQYIRVGVPVFFKFIGAFLLADIVYNLICSILPMDVQFAVLLDSLLTFAATVYFILQTNVLYAIFYLRTRRPVTLEGEPKPVSYWLREHMETDIEPDEPQTPVDEAETEASPEDTPETNEAKETDHEEPVR